MRPARILLACQTQGCFAQTSVEFDPDEVLVHIHAGGIAIDAGIDLPAGWCAPPLSCPDHSTPQQLEQRRLDAELA